MQVSSKELSETQVKLEVTLDEGDITPYLETAASHISQHTSIPGFRPGKAPYAVVKKYVGEDKIFKEALDQIVNSTLHSAIHKENLDVYDESDFQLKEFTIAKIVYTITLTLYPKITLGDWAALKIAKSSVTVTDEEAQNAAEDLAKMVTSEHMVEREARLGDKTFVDFEVSVDGKVIEGGTGQNFGLILGEGKMIPGFEDQVVGHKAKDEFTFNLDFPKDYVPHLAGKNASFKVKLNSVLERTTPPVDDDLAKRLGETDKAALLSRLKENLKREKDEKETEKAEIEALTKIKEQTQFGPVPDKMLSDETDKLLAEFEHELAHQGAQLDAYLKQSGKTIDQVRADLKEKALDRIRTSMVISQIVIDNQIAVSDEEVDNELSAQKAYYQNNDQVLKEISHPNYRTHLKNRMLNHRAIQFIAEKIITK